MSLPGYLEENTTAIADNDAAGDDSGAEASGEDPPPMWRPKKALPHHLTGPLQGLEESRSGTPGVLTEGTEEGAGNGAEAGQGGDNYNNRPPNILVYAGNNEEYFDAIKKTLLGCFKKDRSVLETNVSVCTSS